MASTTDKITEQLHRKIDALSPQRQRGLLALIESFEGDEQTIEDIDPRDSLRQALKEMEAGESRPVREIWDRTGL
jgi:hypothetical protein